MCRESTGDAQCLPGRKREQVKENRSTDPQGDSEGDIASTLTDRELHCPLADLLIVFSYMRRQHAVIVWIVQCRSTHFDGSSIAPQRNLVSCYPFRLLRAGQIQERTGIIRDYFEATLSSQRDLRLRATVAQSMPPLYGNLGGMAVRTPPYLRIAASHTA